MREHQLELPGVSREGHLRECLTWLIDHALECSYHTRRMHAAHARYLLAWFGDVLIKSIRYQDIRRFYEQEQQRGVSRESIRKRLCTLRMAMDEAIRRDLMDKLPPWVVIKSDSRPKDAFWTLEQWEQARSVCDDTDLRAWIDVGFWTGMRTSDLNRFRWCDVELWKKTWVRRATKNKIPPAVLPLPDRLHTLLLARFGELQPHPRDLVSMRNLGHPNRPIKSLCHRAGVPLIGPHGLRHSCETYLYEQGADSAFAMLWLGHKSERSLSVYRHQTEKTIARGLAAVNTGGK